MWRVIVFREYDNLQGGENNFMERCHKTQNEACIPSKHDAFRAVKPPRSRAIVSHFLKVGRKPSTTLCSVVAFGGITNTTEVSAI